MRIFMVAFLFFAFFSNAFATLNHLEKIGIGTWEVDSLDTSLKKVESMKFGWHYDWRTTKLYSPHPGSPRTVPFVPMVWDETHVNESLPRAEALLSFNEPDHPRQANMTVDQAIALWPKLMNRGLRLGSPAAANRSLSGNSWLGRFMQKANALGYRVDFIALHFYSNTGDVEEFKNYLYAAYSVYRKPIWVTEWALADWSNPGRFTYEENAIFAAKALEMLDDLPFVEKHAWFSGPKNKDGLNSNLFFIKDQLTPVGKVFQRALARETH